MEKDMSSFESPRAEAQERNLRLLAKDIFRHGAVHAQGTRAAVDPNHDLQHKGLMASRFVRSSSPVSISEPSVPAPQTALLSSTLVASDAASSLTAGRGLPGQTAQRSQVIASQRLTQPLAQGPVSMGYVSLTTPHGGTLRIPRAGGTVHAEARVPIHRNHTFPADAARNESWVSPQVQLRGTRGSPRLLPLDPADAKRFRRAVLRASKRAPQPAVQDDPDLMHSPRM